MRTNLDDLAADLAELDALIEQQRERVILLHQQHIAAANVLSQWEALRAKLHSLAELRKNYETAEANELKWIQTADSTDF